MYWQWNINNKLSRTDYLFVKFIFPPTLMLSLSTFILFPIILSTGSSKFRWSIVVVERLQVSPFKPKSRVWSPYLAPTYHSTLNCIHVYPSYSSVPFIRAVLRAHKKPRVAVVEFHVSVSNFCLTFLSSMHDTWCVNIMTWIAYIVLKS